MSGESKASVGVILASVREGRRGAAFADWTMAQLGGRDDLEAQLLDLKEWPLPPYEHAENAVAVERRYQPNSLAGRWRDRIASLDAFVIVTCE